MNFHIPPEIQFSDHVFLEKTPGFVRFHRGPAYPGGFNWDNPGTRIRMLTDARTLQAALFYNARHERMDAANSRGVYLVDGELRGGYSVAERPGMVTLNLPGSTDGKFHLHEIVLPHGDSVEFHGVNFNVDARFAALSPRSATRWVAYGDSITHGFCASDVTRTYPYQVGAARQWQVINLGFGSRQANAADGTVIASLAPSLVSILIGVNDCLHSKPLVQFTADVHGLLTGLRATHPQLPVFLITPLSVPGAGWDNTESRLHAYRDVLRELVTAKRDPNLILIEGPELIPAQTRYFQDGLHPNDEGFHLLAGRLSELLHL